MESLITFLIVNGGGLCLILGIASLSIYLASVVPARKRWKRRRQTDCTIVEKDVNVIDNDGYYMIFSYRDPFDTKQTTVITGPVRVDRSSRWSRDASSLLINRSVGSSTECYPNKDHDVLFKFDKYDDLGLATKNVVWTGWVSFAGLMMFLSGLALLLLQYRRSKRGLNHLEPV